MDVGAHKGGYLYWLARAVGASGRVVAFEPQPAAAEYLRGVVRVAGYGHVEVVEQAVSDVSGPVSLYTPPTRVSTGATLVPNLFPENDATLTIRAVTLDEFLASRRDLPPPRFVEIDVETHELAVLRGAARTLVAAKPVVQIEADQRVYGDRPIGELFDFVAKLGLQGFFFHERRLHPIEEFDLEKHQPERYHTAPNHPGYANNFLFMSAEKETGLLRRYARA